MGRLILLFSFCLNLGRIKLIKGGVMKEAINESYTVTQVILPDALMRLVAKLASKRQQTVNETLRNIVAKQVKEHQKKRKSV